MTMTFETTPAFNAGVRGLIQKCRLSAPVVILKETGELIKELVRLSPPKLPAKTRQSIGLNVANKFAVIANDQVSSDLESIPGKTGRSGIRWIAVSSRYLQGVAPASDKRRASVAELYDLYWRTSLKTGRQKLDFRHPRKRQKVLILQTILTKASTVKKLTTRIQNHVGRLKAGWMVAVGRGIIRLTGAKLPPAWVTRHLPGARGAAIDGTGRKDFPTFTIINRARGIGNKRHGLDFFVRVALKSRAAAMKTNARLFMQGKKNIADYAR